jgi:hypothetical protein
MSHSNACENAPQLPKILGRDGECGPNCIEGNDTPVSDEIRDLIQAVFSKKTGEIQYPIDATHLIPMSTGWLLPFPRSAVTSASHSSSSQDLCSSISLDEFLL